MRIDTGTLALLIVTIVTLATGQVLFKLVAPTIHLAEPRSLLSWRLLIALATYGVATVMWIAVLARVPLTVAFPFYGLTFILVPLLGAIVLGEPLRWNTALGAVLILLGVAVSVRQST